MGRRRTVRWVRRLGPWAVAASLAGAAPAGALGATWGAAQELSGSATLNVGGYAQVTAVSCPTTGACAGVGGYSVSSSVTEAFVASEQGGTWGSAEELPGYAALNVGGQLGSTMAISCPAAGACAVGGSFADASGVAHAFVDDEAQGAWGPAEEVPGFSVLNTAGLASALVALSCSSAGECAAGGIYAASSTDFEPWVDTESHGVWGQAEEVPGIAGINTGTEGSVFSVSCPADGDCTAAGQYTDASGVTQVFLVSEAGGTWSNAVPVVGAAGASSQSQPLPPTIDCPTTGDCALAFDLEDATGTEQSYVDSEAGGTWAAATPVTGINTTTVGSLLLSVSCAAAGECAAVGAYGDNAKEAQAMVVDESGGAWGAAIELPNSGALNAGGGALLQSVDCFAPGDCAAGGIYTDAKGAGQALVADATGGTWGAAEELPGSAALNAGGDGDVTAVACGADGACAAGGYYEDGALQYQALVDATARAVAAPGAPAVRVRAVSARSVELQVRAGAALAPPAAIEYSVDGHAWRRVGVRHARFVVGGLRPATRYRIRVRVVDALGVGPARTVRVRTRA